MPFNPRALISLAVTTCLLAGCMVGPKYHTPSAETPAAYKELTPADFKNTDGWKVAQPKDDALRGKWWEIFNDPQLNGIGREGQCFKPKYRCCRSKFYGARPAG